ncbi:MAG TPA: GNAT family N-acetyltransferase [Actinomycetota bacterium]|nr:GNAT family N-acetyltransferase [Actinomycetota bacterium]
MGSQDVRVEIVTSGTAAAAAAHLFDDPVDEAAAGTFLADEHHHLLIAYIDDAPAGFVTGVELLHPDKPKPEMFLYELGVDEPYRGRGIATALLRRLVDLCQGRGCGSMFALTDEDNAAARATYTKAGGESQPAGVMFTWTFGGRPSEPR